MLRNECLLKASPLFELEKCDQGLHSLQYGQNPVKKVVLPLDLKVSTNFRVADNLGVSL